MPQGQIGSTSIQKTPMAVIGPMEKTKEEKNTKMALHPIQAMHHNQLATSTLLR
jgi:hypothetical protein